MAEKEIPEVVVEGRREWVSETGGGSGAAPSGGGGLDSFLENGQVFGGSMNIPEVDGEDAEKKEEPDKTDHSQPKQNENGQLDWYNEDGSYSHSTPAGTDRSGQSLNDVSVESGNNHGSIPAPTWWNDGLKILTGGSNLPASDVLKQISDLVLAGQTDAGGNNAVLVGTGGAETEHEVSAPPHEVYSSDRLCSYSWIAPGLYERNYSLVQTAAGLYQRSNYSAQTVTGLNERSHPSI